MPVETYVHASPVHRINDLAVSERPQERLERLGARALSDTELIAMILRSGSKGHNVLHVASELLRRAGSLPQLVAWSDAEFVSIKGIGRVKALQLVTVVEICRRVLAHSGETYPVLDAPGKVADYMRSHASGLEVEKFWTLCLNRKNRLLRLCEVTSGTASNSLVHPREVFREAIRYGASAVICVHNHPSGETHPSSADIKVTRQLREAAKILSIDLLDHVIVPSTAANADSIGFYSFQESGLL